MCNFPSATMTYTFIALLGQHLYGQEERLTGIHRTSDSIHPALENSLCSGCSLRTLMLDYLYDFCSISLFQPHNSYPHILVFYPLDQFMSSSLPARQGGFHYSEVHAHCTWGTSPSIWTEWIYCFMLCLPYFFTLMSFLPRYVYNGMVQ